MDLNVWDLLATGEATREAEYAVIQLRNRAICDNDRNSLHNYRLSEQPAKKYKKEPTLSFKIRLIGTLARMQREGGHSSELLESISDLIGEDNE
jgi:hypothetical protein